MLHAAPNKDKADNPLDRMMTAAQIARRKFKSGLPRPRKPQTKRLSPMQALGETFRLLDEFRDTLREETGNADTSTIYAALAYALETKLVFTLTVPDPAGVGVFCDEVMKLKDPTFLGVVFVQVDLDTKSPEYRAVSFAVPFISGTDADELLLMRARRNLITEVEKTLRSLRSRGDA